MAAIELAVFELGFQMFYHSHRQMEYKTSGNTNLPKIPAWQDFLSLVVKRKGSSFVTNDLLFQQNALFT